MKKLFMGIMGPVALVVLCMSSAESFGSGSAPLKKDEFVLLASSDGAKKPIEAFPRGISNVLGIEIGRESISAILSELGDAYLSKKHGEPGNYELRYCAVKKGGGTVLVFESGPSGGWHTLDGFGLILNSSREFKKCVPSPNIPDTIVLGNNFKLGMTRNELTTIMGTPSIVVGEWIGYVYEGRRKMTEAEMDNMAARWPTVKDNPYFDVTASVLARVDRAKVVELWVNKGEFY